MHDARNISVVSDELCILYSAAGLIILAECAIWLGIVGYK